MGVDPANLSDRQWGMIEKEQRKPFGKRAKTNAEIQHEKTTRTERAIHNQFINFCRRHGIDYWHSDPTKKSSIGVGLPDFDCRRNNRGICIEFKVWPGKLTATQLTKFDELRSHGNDVYVCTQTEENDAYSEATRLVAKFFNLSVYEQSQSRGNE